MNASAKPPLALKKRVLSLKQTHQPKTKLGAQGESRARLFLQTHHYQILDHNVVWHYCEIDLIALDLTHDELVFVEVKTRTHREYGHPSLAVNRSKILAMTRVAQAYLREHPWEKAYRFDIITILPGKIEHFENVTF